jgi:hypothetical protein
VSCAGALWPVFSLHLLLSKSKVTQLKEAWFNWWQRHTSARVLDNRSILSKYEMTPPSGNAIVVNHLLAFPSLIFFNTSSRANTQHDEFGACTAKWVKLDVDDGIAQAAQMPHEQCELGHGHGGAACTPVQVADVVLAVVRRAQVQVRKVHLEDNLCNEKRRI